MHLLQRCEGQLLVAIHIEKMINPDAINRSKNTFLVCVSNVPVPYLDNVALIITIKIPLEDINILGMTTPLEILNKVMNNTVETTRENEEITVTNKSDFLRTRDTFFLFKKGIAKIDPAPRKRL